MDKGHYVPGRGRGDRLYSRSDEPFSRYEDGAFQSRISNKQRYMRMAPYPPGPPPYYQKPSILQPASVHNYPSTSTSCLTSSSSDVSVKEKNVDQIAKAMNKLQVFARGKRGALAGLSPEPVCTLPLATRKGQIGLKIPIQTNLFRFETIRRAFHHYQVRFDPEVGSSSFGRKLIKQVEGQAGIFNSYVTDGSSLFCVQLLDNERLTDLTASTTLNTYKISLTHVGSIPNGSPVVMQLMNIIFNNVIQDCFNLKWMGGNYFDVKNPCSIHGTSYSLYPGFQFSVSRYENGSRLMMDVSHKLVSTQTVLEMINSRDLRCIRAHVGGRIVHTRYNDRTYRVEDIDFDKNPLYVFNFRKKDITIMEYYKTRYNITITNMDQPLLSVRSKRKELRAGDPEIIYLVPELCYITGFTNEVRSNSVVMRKFTQQTKLEPQQRIQKMNNFVRQIAGSTEARKVLESFNITLSNESIETEARKLPDFPFVPRDLRFTTRGRLLDPAHLRRWRFLYPAGLEQAITNFLLDLNRLCQEMGMICEPPELFAYRNDSEMLEMTRDLRPDNTDMLLAVIRPNERLYGSLKKALCLQSSIPSQVVLFKNVIERKPPILAKIALQMSCKMGGAGWSIPNMDMDKTMIVGIDAYHDSQKANCSYVGIVAALDIHCSKYHTTWQTHNDRYNILINLRSVLLECLKEFHLLNNHRCERIIIYRDGVSDGQLDRLLNVELKEALDAIQDAQLINTKVAYIVVRKRINARFFFKEGNTYRNPPPGTVVDNEATRPNWMDFYLINQDVKGGTVTPTHFNVIHNETNFQMDELQFITYQLCHLYYNYTGAIRVPAVCQYAHKVAFLIGQYLHDYPSDVLKRKLFYL